MSDKITEHTDGVYLEKHVDTDEFALPSVVYEFTSVRETTVTVRIVETIPDSLDSDQIAFHKDHGVDDWEVQGTELVCEVELDAQADYRSVCAVDSDASIEADALVESPDEFTVSPPKPVAARDGSEATATQSDRTPGTNRAANREATRVVEDGGVDRHDGEHPETDAESSPDHPDRQASPQNDGDADDSPDESDSLVDRFVAELQAGDVTDENLQYLEQQFGARHSATGSVDARIAQLQQDFADLRAYTTALEEFLDENGSAREVLDDVETRLDSLEEDVSAFSSTVETVDTHESELSTLQEDVQKLQADVSRIEERLPPADIDDRISDLESDIADMTGFTRTLREAIQKDPYEDSE
jgi:prefoldin subunit 5